MKTTKMYIKCLFVVLLSYGINCMPAKAQQFVYKRYTSAWVTKLGRDHDGQLSNKLLPSLVYDLKAKISLVIPEREAFLKHKNGNAYIKLYLINPSSDTLAVDREDATVSGVSTEIYVDGVWKIFQSKIGSSCGNSYWTMKLNPQHYLYLELEDKAEGPIKVLYRVRLKTTKYEVVSNPISTNITSDLLQLAGTKPPKFWG